MPGQDFLMEITSMRPYPIPTRAIAATLWIVSCLALPMPALASMAYQDENPEAAPAQVTVPVILEGESLFRVRGFSALPAEQRATLIAGRIESIAADSSIRAEDLRLLEAGDQTRILAGDRLVMTITDTDAKTEDLTRSIISGVYLEKVKSAIVRYRSDRSPRALLKGSSYALGATVIMALALFLLFRTRRHFEKRVELRYKARIQGLRIQSFQVVEAEKLWRGVLQGLRTVLAFLVLVVCLLYLNYVFSCFPWTRPLAARGLALLLDPLRTMGSAILASVPNMAFLAVLIIIFRYVLKLTRIFFTGVEYGTVTVAGFDRDWALPTYKIVRVLIIAFGVVVAYPYLPGSQSEAFKGVSIFVGIVFSLGSTSAIANIVAGYMMTYRRAFKVGDRIGVMDLVGDVIEIRLQVTHLRSIKNEEIIIPNSQILNSHVINYSRLAKDGGLILHTTVGIGYETPWRQVESMLLMAAERTPGLLREPPPFVLQKALGDFCVTYEINVYCDRPQDSPRFYAALHRNILDVFNEYGVQIMTPAYEGDPEIAKIVPKEKWFEAPAKRLERAGPSAGSEEAGAKAFFAPVDAGKTLTDTEEANPVKPVNTDSL
jgi:small-conductance mechanosensitive channel